jgi:mannose-6-phosphate isomerase-like protein (cupin superfamily)
MAPEGRPIDANASLPRRTSLALGISFAASCGTRTDTGYTVSRLAAIDLYSPQQLQERAVALRGRAEASPSGTASETLEMYPQHFTMLAYRTKVAAPKFTSGFADVFLIEAGSAVLETGGAVVNPKVDEATGEIRGSALENSRVQQLHMGDIVHIPAGVPHRMKREPGATLLYFVVKVQESRTPRALLCYSRA